MQTRSLPATAQATNAVYKDPDAGLVYTSNIQMYKSDGRGITFRVAIPDMAQSYYTSFDAVIQNVVPNDVGWAGLAWGGSMPRNPLLLTWKGTGNNVVLSSRIATGHVMPTDYAGAQYTLFKTGTKANATYWQFTALCKGCAAWDSSGSGSESMRYLSPRGGNRLAFAYSPTQPSNPNNASSSIAIHEVHGYWSYDFAQATNTNVEAAVQRLNATS